MYNETKENLRNSIERLRPTIARSHHERGQRGTSASTVGFLVKRIELSSLSREEKITLETEIAQAMSPHWGGINWLTRSLYNVVLAVKNGKGFVGGTNLTSMDSLRKYAIIYRTWKTVEIIEQVPAIQGVAPASERIVRREIAVWQLTSYGEQYSQQMYNKGMGIAQAEVSKLKAMGVLT